MDERLFPDEALAFLREARCDPGARRGLEALSWSFHWSDESAVSVIQGRSPTREQRIAAPLSAAAPPSCRREAYELPIAGTSDASLQIASMSSDRGAQVGREATSRAARLQG
jgi:hypothetical protein